MSSFSHLLQGDIQQLDLVSGPEAAYDHCQTYMPDCQYPLPDLSFTSSSSSRASASSSVTSLEFAVEGGDETVFGNETMEDYQDYNNASITVQPRGELQYI